MKNLGLLAILGFLAAAGCNESKEGAEGNVLFTPDECGRLGGCDFDDSIGTGGAININIRGIGDFSTAGVTLESDDPTVLSIVAIGDVAGRPTWEALATGPGVARVLAIDSSDAEVDFLEVAVQNLTALGLENFIGDAVGPSEDAVYDEVWTVNADQDVSFYVVPMIGAGAPTMGRFVYDATIDAALDPYLLTDADPAAGFISLNAPAGDYEVSFDAGGVFVDVLISVQ